MNIIDYVIVEGLVADIPTFQTDVNTKIGQGYTTNGGVATDGVNLYQAVSKQVITITNAYNITAANVGTAGSGSFILSGNRTANFHPGFKFTVVGSTGNDGEYTVWWTGSSYDNGMDETTIPVKETVVDGTGDGEIVLNP